MMGTGLYQQRFIDDKMLPSMRLFEEEDGRDLASMDEYVDRDSVDFSSHIIEPDFGNQGNQHLPVPSHFSLVFRRQI